MTAMNKRAILTVSILDAVPCVWAAMLIAPYSEEGIMWVILHLEEVFRHPFHIEITEQSGRYVLLFLMVYMLGIGIFLSTRRNYRHGEEHGSARWGDVREIARKYRQRPKSRNKILTQNVSIGLDGRKHRRNLNVLVIGGSGAGKTRFYCKPNLMQANTSFVVLDPNGETNYSHFFITFFQRREMQ